MGAGDGRVVHAMAAAGFEAHGYENDLLLVLLSKLWENKQDATNGGSSKIHWQDMWQVDCSEVDVVIVYQWDLHMMRLEDKLRDELKPGAVVISNSFVFDEWEEELADETHGIYVYRAAASEDQ